MNPIPLLVHQAHRALSLLPEERPASPVEYSARLVVFVVCAGGLSVVASVALFNGVVDPGTLIVGGVIVFVGTYCGVRMTGTVDSHWSSSVFVHLALTFALGPAGAVVASVAQASASWARLRNGWFRTIFNVSNFLLTDISAWLIFTHLSAVHRSVAWGAFAATVAGAAELVVNTTLLAAVIWLASNGRVKAWPVLLRTLTSQGAYNVGYGWAAYGAVLLYHAGGAVAFSTSLVPVMLLQGFLVLLARRIRAQEAEREAHAHEREALLQQAIDASDAERKRIASDLHDGVVQTLAGLAFSLSARGSGAEDAQLLDAAATLRSSVTDLRTLMIEIAPPDLAQTGVDGALRKLLEPLPARGIDVEFTAADATHLPAEKTSLLFRVAQEAIRNVVNHSQANKVTTDLKYVDGVVTLRVQDNGKGFTPADRSRRREQGHVGLHLLNNAVEASSGRLSLTSEPGVGTSLMLELPC